MVWDNWISTLKKKKKGSVPSWIKTKCERQNYKMMVVNTENIEVGKYYLCKTQNTTHKRKD